MPASHPNVLSQALQQHWHMLPSSLSTVVLPIIQAIANGTIAEMRAQYAAAQGVTEQEALQQLHDWQVTNRVDKETGLPFLRTGSGRVRYVGNHTAILPIHGTIFRKANIFMFFSGGTSANMVMATARRLAQMPAIKNVVLDVDSPGGSVGGLVDATNVLRELAKMKNMLSVSEDLNASAAFMLSSVAPVRVNPSSLTGSIGSLAVLENIGRKLANEGVDVEIVRSTPSVLKAVPNSVEPVTAEGRQLVQEAVDKHFNDFLQAISLNKGISMEEALELSAKGRVFDGEQAIEAGLAEGMGTLGSAVEELEDKSNRTLIAFMSKQFNQLKAALLPGNTAAIVETPVPEQPASAAEVINHQNPVIMSDKTDQKPAADQPAVENKANDSDELAKVKAELAKTKQELQAKNEAQATEAKEEFEANNTEFVEALAEDGKIKPVHSSLLCALLNSMYEAEQIAYISGTSQKQEAPADALRGFLGNLQPIIPMNADETDVLDEEALKENPVATANILQEMVKNGEAASVSQAMSMLKQKAV